MNRSRQYILDRELNQKLRTKLMGNPQEVKDFFFSMSVNIMTPDFIKSGYRNNYKVIYEITEGTDFQGEMIYGLHIYEWSSEESEYVMSEKSKLFCCSTELYKTLEGL